MYNSDEFLQAQENQYQSEIADAECKENDEICSSCGLWRETDIDGSLMYEVCVFCEGIILEAN